MVFMILYFLDVANSTKVVFVFSFLSSSPNLSVAVFIGILSYSGLVFLKSHRRCCRSYLRLILRMMLFMRKSSLAWPLCALEWYIMSPLCKIVKHSSRCVTSPIPIRAYVNLVYFSSYSSSCSRLVGRYL